MSQKLAHIQFMGQMALLGILTLTALPRKPSILSKTVLAWVLFHTSKESVPLLEHWTSYKQRKVIRFAIYTSC